MSEHNNPIREQLLALLYDGHSVVMISPQKTPIVNRKVTFHLEDGSTVELQTESDHNTFMGWWRDTGALMRRMRKIEELPEDIE